MYVYDYTYLIFVLPPLILSLIAQLMVKTRFARYDKVESKRHLTGADAARLLLRAAGITDVEVRPTRGNLTDNYNPSTKTLNLSESTYSSTSIAAIGVAAHETGHAIQHQQGYAALGLRSTLVPAANIGSQFGPILVVIGLIIGSFIENPSFSHIAWYISLAGIALFTLAVLFYLITLPVEFNASRRALQMLKTTGTFDSEELRGTRRVLTAAALTYVAAALAAIGQLLRLIVISNSNNRRR